MNCKNNNEGSKLDSNAHERTLNWPPVLDRFSESVGVVV